MNIPGQAAILTFVKTVTAKGIIKYSRPNNFEFKRNKSYSAFIKMAMYGEPSFADLLPAYYCNNYMLSGRQQNCASIWKGILTHLIAMAITVGLCLGGYFYYQNIYLPQHKDHVSIKEKPNSIQTKQSHIETLTSTERSLAENKNTQINNLKQELQTIYTWRSTVNAQLTRMQWEQDIRINNAVEEALEIYSADGIGQMDYAASYAGGVIVGISKDTIPHPTHRPLSLFKIVNVDVLSSPEEIIRTCILPGSCFAFRGDSGSVRIKLGKPINIGGITLSHASKLLLGLEGMTSAPKNFEVHGFTDIDDDTGSFLGRFKYNWEGRQHQTFEVKKNLSKNQIFEEVALTILSNYGKAQFTCVYRFRVHKSDVHSTGRSSQTPDAFATKKTKKCC